MVYTESITETINGNTQDCVDELQDIKNSIKLLLERAIDILPDDDIAHFGSIKDDSKSGWYSQILEHIDDHDYTSCDSIAGAIFKLKEFIADEERRNQAYFLINLMSSEELTEFLERNS